VKDRRDYKRASEIVGRIIRAWDPYCLIAEGAPTDEFDGEIAKITARIPSFRSSADVASAISEVFLSSFGQAESFSFKDCSESAEQMFLELGRASLLPAA
jgi:hypothetical protein